jgi:hypothetical protein
MKIKIPNIAWISQLNPPGSKEWKREKNIKRPKPKAKKVAK